MNTFRFSRAQNLAHVLGPVLTIAMVTAFLAGCTPEATTPDTEGTSSSPAAMEQSSSSSAEEAAMGDYADGTYSATGEYRSPAGEESVDVSLTIADGVVTAATFKGNATRPKSVEMQGNFSQGFEALVVGKSIDEVSLGVVNGSSLTPKGFMDAVEKIKAEASA